MRIMLIGIGQLGSDLVKTLEPIHDLIPLTHDDLDVAEEHVVEAAMDALRPDLVINTAAFHNVDECKSNPLKAFGVNTLGTHNLARVCHHHKATLLHISTDYIFGGDKTRSTPYNEDDVPFPINVYGVTKLLGEFHIRATLEHHFIVRTSALFGASKPPSKGLNFVDLMLKLAREGKPIQVVNDQVVSPTYTEDLANQIRILIQSTLYGTYHAAGWWPTSWFEFARTIFEFSDLNPDLSPVTSQEFYCGKNGAFRPHYSALTNQALYNAGLISMRSWEEGLLDYLRK